MNLLKRKIGTLVLVASLLSIAPQSKAAYASGVAAGLLGGLSISFGIAMATNNNWNPLGVFVFILTPITIGAVILDGEHVEFQKLDLDSELAAELMDKGVTTEDILSFNAEVPELNAISSHISVSLSEVNEELALKESARLWKENLQYLGDGSQNTLKALIAN